MITAAQLKLRELPTPKFWTYALVDPRNDEIRYIGQTKGIHKRHILPVYSESKPKQEWLNDLAERGLKPKIMLIESALTAEIASESEDYWLNQLLRLGANLLNVQLSGKRKETK